MHRIILRLLLISALLFTFIPLFAQLELNAALDLMISKGGENSHWYWNGVDENEKDTRFGIFGIAASAKYSKAHWDLNVGALYERTNDQGLDRLVFREANLDIRPKSGSVFSMTIGRFISPYGNELQKQYQNERTFIDRPLFYSYYSNLSPRIGWTESLGNKNTPNVGNGLEWGIPYYYYHGYSNGIKLLLPFKKGDQKLEIAVTTVAPPFTSSFEEVGNISFVGRYAARVSHIISLGISGSYGSVLNEVDFNSGLVEAPSYRQILAGVDLNFQWSYFNLNLAIDGAFYNAPYFDKESESLVTTTSGETAYQKLSSYSFCGDIQYEVPFISGAFLAYRYDRLEGSTPDAFSSSWEPLVYRHSMAVGYKINPYSLLKATVSFQEMEEHDWDLTVWRGLLSIYF